MLKKFLNAHVDLLGEDRSGKFLENIQLSSATASEQTLSDMLTQFSQTGSRTSEIEAVESELLKTPAIASLKALSPAIYWILVTAFEYRMKRQKKDIDRTELAHRVKSRITNAVSIKGAYMAYKHAANLANPLYGYTHSRSQTRVSASTDVGRHEFEKTQGVTVPEKELYELDYCNSDFRKVLFAACRYHGIEEERLRDLNSLIVLLVELGFQDADHDDYVSSYSTLITGGFCKREAKGAMDYRHFRRNGKASRGD